MFRTCIVNLNNNLVENVIDYEEKQTGIPPGYSDIYLAVPSDTGQIGATYIDGQFENPLPPPTPNEIALANCKTLASNLLYETDWTQIPDCPLVNKQEFYNWRSIIRNYALNPVTNPDFPPKPTCIWN